MVKTIAEQIIASGLSSSHRSISKTSIRSNDERSVQEGEMYTYEDGSKLFEFIGRAGQDNERSPKNDGTDRDFDDSPEGLERAAAKGK
jgi:hypothetical protein